MTAYGPRVRSQAIAVADGAFSGSYQGGEYHPGVSPCGLLRGNDYRGTEHAARGRTQSANDVKRGDRMVSV